MIRHAVADGDLDEDIIDPRRSYTSAPLITYDVRPP
jgi:hypothetical protein